MEPAGQGGGDERRVSDGEDKGGWVTGLLTGAERFLNAVLGSDSPSSSSYASSDSRDGNYSLALASVRNNEMDYVDTNSALASEMDSKEAIEQLLLQETFSREESENLIKLIQSRVVDSDARPISWKKGTATPTKELGFVSHSSPEFLSLGSSPYRSPEVEKKAINEAKKWLEEKKSSERGQSSLNTNLLEFDPETGSSPVDVAKSFMKSQKDGIKVLLKRGYESSEMGNDPLDTSKRVKLMFRENSFDISNFKNNINITSQTPQAPSVVNEGSILTAIPLDPLDPRASLSHETYNLAPKLQNDEGQKEKLDNAWMPYATCAVDPTLVNNEGAVAQNPDVCTVPKLMLQEDIGTIPSPNGGRGGRTRRGRGGNTTRVTNKPTTPRKTNNKKSEEIPEKKIAEKKTVCRPRRGKGKLN